MNLKTKKKNLCAFYSCGFDQYLCVRLMVVFTIWSMVLIVLKAGGKVGSFISSGGYSYNEVTIRGFKLFKMITSYTEGKLTWLQI